MNIVFLIKRPLVPRDFERYGVAYMLDHGHRVTVLDVSPAYHPELDNSQAGVVQDQRLDLRVIPSWAALRRESEVLCQADAVFFLIQSFGHSRQTIPALRLMRKLDCPILIMAPAMYAGGAPKIEELPLSRALKEAWGRFQYADPLNSVIARLPRRWLGVPEADQVVYSSVGSMRPNSLIGPGTRPIYTHTPDYEIYRRFRDLTLARREQAVFIDQWLPFHPDFVAGRTVLRIEPDSYYRPLNRLFDRIERELGLEVVIAAHPRADYTLHADVFAGRRLVAGRTAELIAESRLVVAHYSTAIGLAAAFKTATMILADRMLYDNSPSTRHNHDSFAAELGTRVHFLDQWADVDLTEVLAFDHQCYQRYVDRYMRHPQAPDLPMWDTITAAIGS